MASVSSLGIGSGLDLNSLLANLRSAEQAPLVALQQQQRSYTAKLSAYGQINSALSTLQSAATALAKPELFQGLKAGSSAADVLTAKAAASAASGSYSVNVTQLAQAQSLAATGVASTTAAIGAGTATTVTIDFGTITGGVLDPVSGQYSGAGFDPDSTRTATSITLDASNNSLAGIRDAINANADIGVTASIVNDGSATPNRLVLTSKQTGEASSMRVAVSGDAALSNLLAHDPAATQRLQQTVGAQNTRLSVNGIAITSATQTVEGAISDVTLNVAKVGSSTLTVQNDTASVQAAITSFVNAYNGLHSAASKLTAFDADSKSAAALLGDATLRNIQVRIRSTLTVAQLPGDSNLTMLSHIGIAFQKDGTLAIDSAKLTTALGSQLGGVAQLFSGSAGTGGYASQMASLITGMTDDNGTLTAVTKGINTSLDTLDKQYTATSERVDATVARYKAQFTQLDVMMSTMNRTSAYLTQQFESMSNNNSK